MNESKKQISFGIIISYLIIVVQFLTGIVYTPIVLNTLGQNQYGVYSLCTSFMGYFTMMNSGVNAAYIRFYVQTKEKNPEDLNRLSGLFLKLFIGISLIAMSGGLIACCFSTQIFGKNISPEEYVLVRECFLYLSISSAAQVLNCVFSSLIIANEKFIYGKAINLFISIANPIITVPFLYMGYSCVVIVVIHMITAIIALLVNFYYCRSRLKVKFDLSKNEKNILMNVSLFAGFIVLQGVTDQINWQLDKFILARTHGTEQISVYSVGATFNRYFIMFSGALSNVFIAKINRLYAREDETGISDLFVKTSRIFAYLIWLFMSAYIIFGKQFVLRWAGSEYGESYLIGLLLMLPVTASLTMGLGQDIARSKNKHHIQIIINLAICVVNALVSIPLAIKWGAVGSAIGTFGAEMLMCVVAEPIYYKKCLNLDIKALLKELLKIIRGLVAPIVFGIAITFTDVVKPNYLSMALYGSIYVVVYFISMWLFAMNLSEKQIVNKAMNKLGIRSVRG